jgi:hypothetical protein
MLLEPFSAGYFIAPSLELTTYNGTRPIVRDDVFSELVIESGGDPPIVSLGDRHVEVYPDTQIPDNYLAVPSGDGENGASVDGGAVLILRQDFGFGGLIHYE